MCIRRAQVLLKNMNPRLTPLGNMATSLPFTISADVQANDGRLENGELLVFGSIIDLIPVATSLSLSVKATATSVTSWWSTTIPRSSASTTHKNELSGELNRSKLTVYEDVS